VWIRKLHRMGTSVVLTVPRDVMRVWERAHIGHVVITYEGEQLRVQPLTPEDLLNYPRPEEEELDGRSLR